MELIKDAIGFQFVGSRLPGTQFRILRFPNSIRLFEFLELLLQYLGLPLFVGLGLSLGALSPELVKDFSTPGKVLRLIAASHLVLLAEVEDVLQHVVVELEL